MTRAAGKTNGLRVAVTGATGGLGTLLLPLLQRDPRVERVVAVDIAKPLEAGPKVVYHHVDLTRYDAESTLRERLVQEEVDTLYHLAFVFGRVRDSAFAHELEVAGTASVITAAKIAGVSRLVVPSLTAVYGARSTHPALLREDAPLHGCPGSRFINDKVEVERQLRSFRETNPRTRVVVLRFASIIGNTVDNPVTRLLRARVVPTLLGFDPLFQVLHEEDAAQALHLALTADVNGAFNIIGKGSLSLSGLIRQAKGIVLPLPRPIAGALLSAMNSYGRAGVPPTLLDYIHYAWVADGARAREELGFSARYHVTDAVAAMRRA